MNSSFKDRGNSFEAKYAHDEEFAFKAHARRNKLLGLWVANLLGFDHSTAEVYAKTVIMADFEEPGDGDVIRKVIADLASAGKEITEKEIIDKLAILLDQAIAELSQESK